MASEVAVAEVIRGFVPTGQLIADLPWDACDPSENHLKQLVRRTRKALVLAGIGDLIESRRCFGYRLRVVPSAGARGRLPGAYPHVALTTRRGPTTIARWSHSPPLVPVGAGRSRRARAPGIAR
jgi:hypothetical protein